MLAGLRAASENHCGTRSSVCFQRVAKNWLSHLVPSRPSDSQLFRLARDRIGTESISPREALVMMSLQLNLLDTFPRLDFLMFDLCNCALEILERLDAMAGHFKTVECPRCEGVGRHYQPDLRGRPRDPWIWAPCELCDGSGKQTLWVPDTDYRIWEEDWTSPGFVDTS